ncbi:MAG: thioesterase family protein, partial [Micromonosporaceae bacterium]
MDVTPGLSARVELVVGDADTAQTLGSGDVPVLGTPRVLALCEAATVAATASQLPGDSTTVGT